MSEALPELDGEERSSLLDALLENQCKCWEPGQAAPKRVEAYLAEYPALQSDSDAVLVLIYNEYRLRKKRGETPQEQEYFRRFPAHEHALRQQFELHGEVGPLLDPSTPKRDQGTVLEDSAARAEVPGTASEEFPHVSGYTIQEELGKGAWGVVYKAWHHALHRHVALKMIRPGTATGREELARFHREAQAVARLQHPYIVQIYDIGDVGGQPFLALELVDGGSLADHLHGIPQPASQAAQLIETLARAIHYAHQRRIVHRDLKPGNVLLTPDNTPKITDFGLAKRLDGSGSASDRDRGAIAGTPSYMAPEQASPEKGQVGPHTDVHALGVILYEMLTGLPPFRSTELLDTLKQVCTQEPVPPRRLQPKVPRDLEAICLKCLKKEPTERYTSALALAEDLDRFLDGKPVLARPMKPAERLWRRRRRNPLVASLLTGIFLVLAGGFGVSTSFWLRADYERQQAVGMGLRLDLERKKAEELAQRRDEERKQALELQEELARNFFPLITRFNELGLSAEAVRVGKPTRALVEKLVGAHPTSREFQIFLASTLHDLGSAYVVSNQYKAALECCKHNCDLYEKLVKENPENIQYRSDLGNCYLALGEAQRHDDQQEAALRSYEQARKILDELVREKGPGHGALARLARTDLSLGLLHYDRKQWDAASLFCSQACDRFLELIKYYHDPYNVSYLAVALQRLGQVRVNEGNLKAGRILFGQAIERQRVAFNKEPKVDQYRVQLVQHYRELANVLRQLGKPAEAVDASLEQRRLLLRDPNTLYNVTRELAACMELVAKARLTSALRNSANARSTPWKR